MEADDLQSDQSWAGQAGVDEAGERRIADRLDALEAEKVIKRALELEAESLDEPHKISTDQLERIAEEIGVDSAFIHQALSEVKLTPAERSRFASWVLPEPLFETVTISGVSRQELDDAITKWMAQREGLTAGARLEDGTRWDVDRRWRAKARAKTLSGDNRISRVAGGDLTHRVQSIKQDEHLVAFESEGHLPLLLARLAMAGGAALGLLMLWGAIVSGDALIGLGVSAAIVAAAVAIGVGGARWWARGVRGALSRSLIGLSDRIASGGKGLLDRFRRRKPKSD